MVWFQRLEGTLHQRSVVATIAYRVVFVMGLAGHYRLFHASGRGPSLLYITIVGFVWFLMFQFMSIWSLSMVLVMMAVFPPAMLTAVLDECTRRSSKVSYAKWKDCMHDGETCCLYARFILLFALPSYWTQARNPRLLRPLGRIWGGHRRCFRRSKEPDGP